MCCVTLSVCPHRVERCTRVCLCLQHDLLAGQTVCQLPTNELGYKCTLKVTQIFIVIKSDLMPSLLTSLDGYRIMCLKPQGILTVYQNLISEF